MPVSILGATIAEIAGGQAREGVDQLLGINAGVDQLGCFGQLVAGARVQNRLTCGQLGKEADGAAAGIDVAIGEGQYGRVKRRKEWLQRLVGLGTKEKAAGTALQIGEAWNGLSNRAHKQPSQLRQCVMGLHDRQEVDAATYDANDPDHGPEIGRNQLG
jgi:hypothetical protein